MRPCLRTAAAILFVLASCAGCGQAWQTFDRCPPGQPIPPDVPESAWRGPLGMSYSETSQTLVPVGGRWATVEVLSGDGGRTVGRRFYELSATHWGLCITGQTRYVLEVQIPPTSFHNPPPDWNGERETLTVMLGQILMALCALPPRETEPEPVAEGKQPAALSESLTFSTLMRMLPPLIQKAHDTAEQTQEAIFDLNDLKPDDAAPPAELEPPAHVPAYLALVEAIAHAIPSTDFEDNPFARALLGLMLTSAQVADLLEQPGAFADVTAPGWQWEKKGPRGIVYRVQNLGDRRVRMEIVEFHLRDPILPLFGVSY